VLISDVKACDMNDRKHSATGFSSYQDRNAQDRSTVVPMAPLPDPIGDTIETIIALRAKAEQNVSPQQRRVETITEFFGRPSFLYGTIVVIILWLVSNTLPINWSFLHFDPPPYEGLDKTLGIVSLLMTAAVLVRQSRQELLAEQRAQLNLQLDLLTEQKIAKLISLIEELRRDLPDVHDRHDPEAEAMQTAVNPHTVLETLEETLNEELVQLQKQALEEVES
jgi:uncharacterized membrane protein